MIRPTPERSSDRGREPYAGCALSPRKKERGTIHTPKAHECRPRKTTRRTHGGRGSEVEEVVVEPPGRNPTSRTRVYGGEVRNRRGWGIPLWRAVGPDDGDDSTNDSY